jgi:hypothetical protein
MEIKLGDVAKDTITGFEGVAIARTEWLNGCVRISLQPKKLQENGKPIDSETFDETQLAIVAPGLRHVEVRTGGPRPAPTRARDPR